jgi:tRNA1Val (adenine37-N6)-methyltransferase
MTGGFHFRQFSIAHDRCGMKVGTDGVLLGACAEVQYAHAILDIGTGSGLIAIMAAQRSAAQITGIEIDSESAAQAAENTAQCPWSERIDIVNVSLQEYGESAGQKFDCIVCNPPFYQRQLKSPHDNRNRVRHDVELNYDDLLRGADILLTQEGAFWLILPASVCREFAGLSSAQGFEPRQLVWIYPKEGKSAHRIIICLHKSAGGKMLEKSLTIRNKNDDFTEAYKDLTRAYYINF